MELPYFSEKRRKIRLLKESLKKDDNKLCADCKNDSPSMASIDLGVMLCKNCSFYHMVLLETNIRRLKLLTKLEKWSVEELDIFIKITNKIANNYWEYNLKYCDFNSVCQDKQKFIINKYKDKKWVNRNIDGINPKEKIINNYFPKKDANTYPFDRFNIRQNLENINDTRGNEIYNDIYFQNTQNNSGGVGDYSNQINQIIENEDKDRDNIEKERTEREKKDEEIKERERLQKQSIERERDRIEGESLEGEEIEINQRERIEILERERKEKIEEDIMLIIINDKYNNIKNDLSKPFYLDKIKLEKLIKSNNGKCVICLENFEENSQVLYLPCFHLFHSNCILRWLLDHNKCPNCLNGYKEEEEESYDNEEEESSNEYPNNNYICFSNNNNYRQRGRYWRGRGRFWNNQGRGRGNGNRRGRGNFHGMGNDQRRFNNNGRGRGYFRGYKRSIYGGRGQMNRGNYRYQNRRYHINDSSSSDSF